jgi:hypothetical protein
VTARRSRSSSHSRTFRSRQSCEPNSAIIVPFVSRRPSVQQMQPPPIRKRDRFDGGEIGIS